MRQDIIVGLGCVGLAIGGFYRMGLDTTIVFGIMVVIVGIGFLTGIIRFHLTE